MRSDTTEAGWHRFHGWWRRRWRRPSDGPSATPMNDTERNAPRNSEELNAWEDEGGAVKDRAAAPQDAEHIVTGP